MTSEFNWGGGAEETFPLESLFFGGKSPLASSVEMPHDFERISL